MKLSFLGTKGYVEEKSEYHQMHTLTVVAYKKTKVVIDCGQDWLGKLNRLKKYNPKAILITHAHPDHAWGLKEDAPYPVYASEISWKLMNNYEVPKEKRFIVQPYKKFKIGDLTIELFPVQHSIKCPGNSYKITGNVTIFYSGDLIYIDERKKALKNVDCYVGEASSWSIPMVRKTDKGKLFGHATIKTQITWCQKAKIPKAIFTHCGKQIIEMGYKIASKQLEKLGKEKYVNVILAYDGMDVILKRIRKL